MTWEDADQLAMNAVEPIVRKLPEQWLSSIEPWLADASLWVRRTGVTVVGRLPSKRPEFTTRCLDLIERLLDDTETDVQKAVSFAIRLAARGDMEPVRRFLARHVPPKGGESPWVLCDAIRSMAKKLLPEFVSLTPKYEKWSKDAELAAKDRRSVESAVKTLRSTR